MKVRSEKWTSSENRKEIHFFIEGTSIYLFGVNPKYIKKKDVNLLLKKLKNVSL